MRGWRPPRVASNTVRECSGNPGDKDADFTRTQPKMIEQAEHRAVAHTGDDRK